MPLFPGDFKKFKHVKSDDKSTTLMHPKGHTITIMHEALKGPMRAQFEALAKTSKPEPKVKMDEGGMIEKADRSGIMGTPRKVNQELADQKTQSASAPQYRDNKDVRTPEQKAKADYYEKTGRLQGYADGGDVEEPSGASGTWEPPTPQQPQIGAGFMDSPEHAQAWEPGNVAESVGSRAKEAVDRELHLPATEVAVSAADAKMQANNANMANADIQQQLGTAPPPMPPQQVGMAPQPMPQGPPQQQQPAEAPPVTGEELFNAGMQNQIAGIQNQAKAESQLGNAQAKMMLEQQKQQNQIMADYNRHLNELDQERKEHIQFIKDNQVDPEKYWQTHDKTLAMMGAMFGSFGTPGHNMGIEVVNRGIDNEINAQKQNLDSRQSLLNANLQQYGNMREAMNATRIMLNDAMTLKIETEAAKFKSPMAQAKAAKMIGDLQTENAKQADTFAKARTENQIKAQLTNTNSAPGSITEDPAVYVRHLVPPERQKEVFAEIQAAQNTKHMGKSIMDAFETAAKENTIAKTGFGLARTPGSVYGLHQAMQPTFQDLEGTVRQAAMENTFKNITPSPGDSAHTIDQKRHSLQQYLQSKASAPTAKGFGIDLQKFDSTNSGSFTGPQTKIINGIKYQVSPDGKKAIRVKE